MGRIGGKMDLASLSGERGNLNAHIRRLSGSVCSHWTYTQGMTQTFLSWMCVHQSGKPMCSETQDAWTPRASWFMRCNCGNPVVHPWGRGGIHFSAFLSRANRHTLFHCTSQILLFFLKYWRLVATLHWASLSAPFFQKALLTLSLCVAIWKFSHYVRLLHYYYICYGDPYSVICDITPANTWQLAEGSDDC